VRLSEEKTMGSIENICNLEQELLKGPQIELSVTHEFCDGLYARTMMIPAGTVLTGAIHAKDCFFQVRKGRLVVTTDDGVAILEAGDLRLSRKGTKRAGVALDDVVVTTFHPNTDNEQSPEVLWDRFTAPNPEGYELAYQAARSLLK
jgi:hypothetical protein